MAGGTYLLSKSSLAGIGCSSLDPGDSTAGLPCLSFDASDVCWFSKPVRGKDARAPSSGRAVANQRDGGKPIPPPPPPPPRR